MPQSGVMSFCLPVHFLSPETRTCRALADWPSNAVMLAAVSGRSAAGPVRPVSDLLMAAAAYRIGNSGYTHL